MQRLLACATLLGGVLLLALVVGRQPIPVTQRLAESKASRTATPGAELLPEATVALAPGDTLTQRFTPRADGPSALTVRLRSREGQPTPALRMTLRDPRGAAVNTWRIP